MAMKPNWKSDFKAIVSDLNTGVSEQFIFKMCEIFNGLNFSPEDISKIILKLEAHITSYSTYNLVQANFPSLAQQRAANEELLNTTEKLLGLLSTNDMGGIRQRISMQLNPVAEINSERDLFRVALESSSGLYFEPLINELTKLKSACVYFNEYHYPRLKKLPKQSSLGLGQESPKQRLSFSIASYMKNQLDIEPTSYISDDYEKQGVFAEILSNCFLEADGRVPSDLKRHIIWACQKIRGNK